MKTTILILAITCSAFNYVFSQDADHTKGSLFLSGGPEFTLPLNNLGNPFQLGVGFSFQGDYVIVDNLALNVNIGYRRYLYLTSESEAFYSYGNTPFLVGARYFAGKTFYVQGQMGLTFAGYYYGHSSAFTLAPSIGFKTNHFDFTARYQASFKDGVASELGIRLAYTYGFHF